MVNTIGNFYFSNFSLRLATGGQRSSMSKRWDADWCLFLHVELCSCMQGEILHTFCSWATRMRGRKLQVQMWIKEQNSMWEGFVAYGKPCTDEGLQFVQIHTACEGLVSYRKIPNISRGLIEVSKPFLGGLYSGGGLIFGEAYIRREFCVSVRV